MGISHSQKESILRYLVFKQIFCRICHAKRQLAQWKVQLVIDMLVVEQLVMVLIVIFFMVWDWSLRLVYLRIAGMT
uniref:Uncharacterized protein n=1 Tax=Rhizophora mucronata TaxID=61149 RepID=A0A2P2QTG7_RHIMU